MVLGLGQGRVVGKTHSGQGPSPLTDALLPHNQVEKHVFKKTF